MDRTLSFRPVCEAMGVELLDFEFDGARELDEVMRAELRELLDESQLLVFRGVSLDGEAQVALLEAFGPPLVENDAGRSYQFVSNTHDEGILGDERFAFHSDHAFMSDPIDVISLFGLEIPAGGSCTRFVNAMAAARSLPDDLCRRVKGRNARHIIDPAEESGVVAIDGSRRSGNLPHAYHPILSLHPRSGEEILYVSEQQTDSIEGLGREEGRSLIAALFEHLYSPRFRYVHEWQEGDLLIWDNRALQHARDAVEPGTSRNLRRVSVGGTSVYEFFRRHPKWGQ